MRMSSKQKIVSLTLCLSSVLFPLYLFSLFDLVIGATNDKTRVASPEIIEKTRIQDEDIPQKIEAIKEGYLPVFYPHLISHHFANTEYYPIGSLPHTSTYYCNEGYGLVTYITDRFGLRNTDSSWDLAKTLNTTLFIGDSFTHGACVPHPKTLPELIGKLTAENTINLGSASNGPYEYIALIKSIVNPFLRNTSGTDKKVVMVFYDNDNVPQSKDKDIIVSNVKEIAELSQDGSFSPSTEYIQILKNQIKSNYPLDPSSIQDKVLISAEPTFSNRGVKDSFIYKFATLAPIRSKLSKLIKDHKNKAITGDPSTYAIRVLKQTCSSESSCTPFVLYIPSSNFWRKDHRSLSYKTMLADASKANDLNFIDGSKVINSDLLDDYAPKGPHLSVEGYNKLANLLASHFSSHLN